LRVRVCRRLDDLPGQRHQLGQIHLRWTTRWGARGSTSEAAWDSTATPRRTSASRCARRARCTMQEFVQHPDPDLG
jgi:hypothetical protein